MPVGNSFAIPFIINREVSSPLSNMLHYWKLDETAGEALDYYGTFDSNGVTATQNIAGKFNRCYQFNGINDYVYFGVFVSPASMTLSCWIKKTTAVLWSTFYGLNGPSGGLLFNHTTGEIRYTRNDGTNLASWLGALVDDINFHHIVITFSGFGIGNTIELFIDGVSQGQRICVTEAPNRFVLGAASDLFSLWYLGLMDDVSIYNKVLSQNEINQIANPVTLFRETDPLIMSFSTAQVGVVVQVPVGIKIDNGFVGKIDWGDGKIHALIADGTEHFILSNYVGLGNYIIKIYGLASTFKHFKLVQYGIGHSYSCSITCTEIQKFTQLKLLWLHYCRCTGDINDLPKSLVNLGLYWLDAPNDATPPGVNQPSGSIDNLSKTLTFLQLEAGGGFTGNTNNVSRYLTVLSLFNNGVIMNIGGNGINLPPLLTDLYLFDLNAFSSDLSEFSRTLRLLQLSNLGNVITGDLSDVPPLLYDFIFESCSNNATGSINTLPATIYLLQIGGADLFGGSLNLLPSRTIIKNIYIHNQSAITGNFEVLGSAVNDTYLIEFLNNNNIKYGGGAVPAWKNATITVTTNMIAADVDAFLIAWSGTSQIADDGQIRVCTLQTNRTAASNAAVAILQANPPRKSIVTIP